jgi:hypothetical protein
LLQFAERTVRAFVDAMETGFVTGGERNRARLIDKAAEREGELKGGIVAGFRFRQLALHFTIEERGFDQTEALHAPAGGDHLVHQTLLDRGARLISSGITPKHFSEFTFIFTI